MASIGQPVPKPVRRWRSDPITRLVSLTPFALALYLDFVARPVLGGGMFWSPPAVAGLPLGLGMQLAFVALAGLGALVIWTTTSRAKATVAFVLCIPIAIVGIVLTPAVILILHNLA